MPTSHLVWVTVWHVVAHGMAWIFSLLIFGIVAHGVVVRIVQTAEVVGAQTFAPLINIGIL